MTCFLRPASSLPFYDPYRCLIWLVYCTIWHLWPPMTCILHSTTCMTCTSTFYNSNFKYVAKLDGVHAALFYDLYCFLLWPCIEYKMICMTLASTTCPLWPVLLPYITCYCEFYEPTRLEIWILAPLAVMTGSICVCTYFYNMLDTQQGCISMQLSFYANTEPRVQQLSSRRSSILWHATVISISQLDSKFKFFHTLAVICNYMRVHIDFYDMLDICFYSSNFKFQREFCASAHIFLWLHTYISMSCFQDICIYDYNYEFLWYLDSNFKIFKMDLIWCKKTSEI